jgi:hypothetical protein
MVRSYWNGALVLTLAWVGAAGAQQPPSNSPPPGQSSERILTFQEPGKPAERCRVLSAQPLPDGKSLLKVQSLTTGEISTIIDGPGGGTAPKGVVPAPAGTPPPAPRLTAPGSVRQVSGQAPANPTERLKPLPVGSPGAPVPATPSGKAAPTGGADGGEYHMVQEPGRRPMRCRLVRRWKTPQGQYACQMQCVETGEMMTLLEEGPATSMPGAAGAGPQRALSTRIFHWGQYNTSPAGAPLPPGESASQVVLHGMPPAPSTTYQQPVVVERPRRLFGSSRTVVAEGPPCGCGSNPPSVLVQGPGFQGGAGPTVVAEGVVPEAVVVEAGPVPQGPGFGERLRGRVQGLFASRTSGSQVVEGPLVLQAPAPTAQVAQASPSVSPYQVRGGPVPSNAPPMTVAQAPQSTQTSPSVSPYQVRGGPVPAQSQPVTVAQASPSGSPYQIRGGPVADNAAPMTVVQAPQGNGIPPRTVVETPPPSDWRKSWADDPSARPAAKPLPPVQVAQAPAARPLPPPPAPPTPQMLPDPAVVQAPAKPATSLSRPPASVTEAKDTRDPLLRPDSLVSRKVDEKFHVSKSVDPAPRVEAKASPPVSEMPRPGQPAVSPSPLAGKVPLGAQSVLAASNGLDRPIQYVPVPIVTVPEVKRPPVPPVPEIPQAPHPNELYQNAFTPSVPPDGQQQAGMPMMGTQAMGYYPPMMPAQPGMMGQPGMPGYNPMMARYPMQGYNPMMAPRPMPMYGYGPMAPGMYPPAPYGMPMGMYGYPYPPMGMPQVPGRGSVPYAYQGPMPPSPLTPTGQPYPPNYNYGYRPMPAPNWAAQPRNTAMDRPAIPAGMSANQSAANDAIREMLAILKTSSYPSQREWAANNLATFEGRSHPAVVEALLTAAKEDPAASVRSGCVYNLARMQVTSEPVLALLRQLKSDRDPRVRTEAEHALARLSPTPQATEPNPVQPVRAVNP